MIPKIDFPFHKVHFCPPKFFVLSLVVWVLIFIARINVVFADNPVITDEAQQLYQQYQDCVYQIRVIDLATGNKSTTGSGFQISPAGYLVTNYHVLADAIQHPQRFRVEYLGHDGATGDLQIRDVDVIHDLAIVKRDGEGHHYLSLGDSVLMKGARIFSFGNPFDLGMTIIEGIYNGLMEKSLYRKILFSGAINPGMSGGPALDHKGQVIGINVSTAGNQVSFLVPVDYLKTLYDKFLSRPSGQKIVWDRYIEQQLYENQEHYLDELIPSSWPSISFGEAVLPDAISKIFKCWGNSEDKDNELYKDAQLTCSIEDDIFISSEFSTGRIFYQYHWLTSKGLNSIRFYNLYERFFDDRYDFENANKDDVTNFECETKFVNVADKNWKVAFCSRQYKKYPTLYDMYLNMAMVEELDQGLLVTVYAYGVSQPKALVFIKKFMKEIKWQK